MLFLLYIFCFGFMRRSRFLSIYLSMPLILPMYTNTIRNDLEPKIREQDSSP